MVDHGYLGMNSLCMETDDDRTDDGSTLGNYHFHDASLSLLNSAKVDPSYKSKRYRDKLRTEIKALEGLLPVDKSTLHRKLDSQTVFRLVIAYFRTKMFLEADGIQGVQCGSAPKAGNRDKVLNGDMMGNHEYDLQSKEILKALDGFLLVVTADGTILYVSKNIIHSLGFNQVDLMHRCVYGIVHPDDHHELKMVLETSLLDTGISLSNQKPCCSKKTPGGEACKSVSFLVRIKCFNGTTTGYLKMQCTGHMRSFPGVVKSPRSSNQVVFALCRPFQAISTDPEEEAKAAGFWSKHGLDLKFKHLDTKTSDVTGYTIEELEGKSFYSLVHPEDLAVFSTCHQILIHTEEIQTMYFRIELKNKQWLWLHTRGKVVFKNSKKYSIVFTHCPVREEDSTYIQQEAIVRHRYALLDLMNQSRPWDTSFNDYSYHKSSSDKTKSKGPASVGFISQDFSVSTQNANTSCPSTWHSKSECHSPVFPTTSLPHRYNPKGSVEHFGSRKRQQIGHTALSPSGASLNPQKPSLISVPSGDCLVSSTYFPLGSGTTDVFNPSQMTLESSSSFTGNERTPQRRYLMHVNGVGVSREPTPTTLYFQGQFTAYETPTSAYSCQQPRSYHTQGPINPSCTFGIMGTPTSSQQHCPQVHRANNNTEVHNHIPTIDNAPITGHSWGNGPAIDSRNKTGGESRLCQSYLPDNETLEPVTHTRAVSLEPPEESHVREAPTMYNNYSSPRYRGSHAINTNICDEDAGGACHRGVARSCWYDNSEPTESKTEDGSHFPSCVYEGKPLVSSEARCFMPNCPPVGLVRVKQDPGGNRKRKSGVADLPNIGSFLEYLKDISG